MYRMFHGSPPPYPLCIRYATVCRFREVNECYTISNYLCISYKLQHQAGVITNTKMLSYIQISQCFIQLLYTSDKFATLLESEHGVVYFGDLYCVYYHPEDEVNCTDEFTSIEWTNGEECRIRCCPLCYENHEHGGDPCSGL